MFGRTHGAQGGLQRASAKYRAGVPVARSSERALVCDGPRTLWLALGLAAPPSLPDQTTLNGRTSLKRSHSAFSDGSSQCCREKWKTEPILKPVTRPLPRQNRPRDLVTLFSEHSLAEADGLEFHVPP